MRLPCSQHNVIRLVIVAATGLAGSGCGQSPSRPPIEFDAGPRDSSVPDAGDAGSDDAGVDSEVSVDSGSADGGTDVDCTAGTPVDLLRTGYLPGGYVPFGAAANVDGLFLGATVWTESGYPNYERVRAYLSSNGNVAASASLSVGVTFPSVATSVAPLDNGFAVLFDDAPAIGMSRDLWLRVADAAGTPMGSTASQWTNTPGKGETNARLARTGTGYVATWIDEDLGPMTALLDASLAVVGTPQAAAAIVGDPSFLAPLVIAGNPYVTYFGTDQRVHGVSVNASGAVAGTPTNLSALTTTGNWAVAGGASGAGLVYELSLAAGRTAVQFRPIGANGTTSLAETRIHPNDGQGQRPSIAPLAGGYLVLFRFIPATGAAKLRLAFVAPAGEVLSTWDLIDDFPDQRRYEVLVSPDNEVYVVYQESQALTVTGGGTIPGAVVRGMRLVCE